MQEAGKICKRIWEELEEDMNGKIKKFILCLGQYLAKDVFVKQDDTCLLLKGMLRIKQNNILKGMQLLKSNKRSCLSRFIKHQMSMTYFVLI